MTEKQEWSETNFIEVIKAGKGEACWAGADSLIMPPSVL
jgi:hypothetical protein